MSCMSHRAQTYVHWILCCQFIRTHCFICRKPATEYVNKNGLTGLQSVNRFTGVQLLNFAPAFQCWCCCWVLILFLLSNEPWFICLLFWFIGELEILHVDRIIWTTAVHRARVKPVQAPPPPHTHTHRQRHLLQTVPRRFFFCCLF